MSLGSGRISRINFKILWRYIYARAENDEESIYWWITQSGDSYWIKISFMNPYTQKLRNNYLSDRFPNSDSPTRYTLH